MKAAAEETLENFSLSDAKRANEYSTSDVQQALAYFTEGEVRALCFVHVFLVSAGRSLACTGFVMPQLHSHPKAPQASS